MSPFARGRRVQRVYWICYCSTIHVTRWVVVMSSLPNPAASAVNMSQSSLAPSTIPLSAQGAALANAAALLFNPALPPSQQSLAASITAPPQSESESLLLQGSSHLQAPVHS